MYFTLFLRYSDNYKNTNWRFNDQVIPIIWQTIAILFLTPSMNTHVQTIINQLNLIFPLVSNRVIPSYRSFHRIFSQETSTKIIIAICIPHTHTHIRFSLLNFTRILSIFYQTSKMKRAMCKHVPLQIRTRISIKNLSRYHGTIRFEKHVHIRAMEQYEMYFETDRAFLFHISSPFHLLVRPINRGRFLSLSRH